MADFATIDDAGSYFNTALYTGNSSSAEIAVTGLGFAPNFVWLKNRDATYDFFMFDSARGATNYVRSNTAAAQGTVAQTLKSFDSDGYTLGTDSDVNYLTSGYGSWSWLGGTTSGIATDGSTTITPSAYSFNQTSGFSAIAYTGNYVQGAKLAHGLGVIPEVVFIKNLQTANDWSVYSYYMKTTNPWDWFQQLNGTTVPVDSTGYWDDTAPDAVNITLGNDNGVNGSSHPMVAYCFASVKGFSKMGAYTGNGDAFGTFVYTGFKPALIILKDTAAGNNWVLFDNKRLGYNWDNNALYPNDNLVEATTDLVDLVSNGFKFKNSHSGINANGSVYIYLAFAEDPFVNTNGVPNNAR